MANYRLVIFFLPPEKERKTFSAELRQISHEELQNKEEMDTLGCEYFQYFPIINK